MENYSKLTDEIVTATYEELIHNGLPFLQIFPQMFQDANIVEIFKIKKSQRNKNITSSQLALKNKNIEEFREQFFFTLWNEFKHFKTSSADPSRILVYAI